MKSRSQLVQLMRSSQAWVLLLFFLASWTLAPTYHSLHQEDQHEEESHCETCYLQQQVRYSHITPKLQINLPILQCEEIQLTYSNFKPYLRDFQTKKSQAPPQV